VHLAERGHPLIGDPVYSGRHGRAPARKGTAAEAVAYFPRQALHARHLGFRHPASGDYLAFDSDLPDDMKSLLATLERL
jgi:23S rRNA pseudouridine1911/1915/1917 synthase